ncbi:MAG: hypothetical protein ACLP5V_04115 [Candidatus Bathyarchaeia archaeon]
MGVKKLTPCEKLSPWRKNILAQLVEFAKTEYDKDFEVNFAEEIIADDDTPVRGKIEGKQIWLDVHHSLTVKELLFYYGFGSNPRYSWARIPPRPHRRKPRI